MVLIVVPQHFSQFDGSLQQPDSFTFQPFCHKFAAVLWVIVLMRNTILVKL